MNEMRGNVKGNSSGTLGTQSIYCEAADLNIDRVPFLKGLVERGSVLPEAEGTAVPAGGCLNQAANQLSQARVGLDAQRSGSSSSLPGSIRMSAFQSAQSDPRVLAVFATWSSCMRAYGYHYATPFDATADPRWLSAKATSPAEIQTAERDTVCKLRVNLLGVEYRVESGYETTAIAKNTAALTDIANQLPTEAAAINHLMARYGS